MISENLPSTWRAPPLPLLRDIVRFSRLSGVLSDDAETVFQESPVPSGFQLHVRSRPRCLSVLSPPTPSRYGLLLQITNRSRSGTPHGKSPKSLAEGRRFELRNPVRGHGFQDDSAVIPNPPSFQSSRRVRSALALADVGPSGALVEAHGHRMGTPEKNEIPLTRRRYALSPAYGPAD